MYFSSDFRGNVVQLTDALDRFDAISNQVVSLHRLFTSFGFKSSISSQWVHPDREAITVNRKDLRLSEEDVLIVHYYGYSEGLEEWLKNQYCTKVMVYHNITPDAFFTDNSKTREFCRKGREQLKNLIGAFHFFWGDSQFNLDELIELGASNEKVAVVPIIVDGDRFEPGEDVAGNWVFVGRIAPNKGIAELVDLFGRVNKRSPAVACKLTLIGGSEPNEGYVDKVRAAIAGSGCSRPDRDSRKVDGRRTR